MRRGVVLGAVLSTMQSLGFGAMVHRRQLEEEERRRQAPPGAVTQRPITPDDLGAVITTNPPIYIPPKRLP